MLHQKGIYLCNILKKSFFSLRFAILIINQFQMMFTLIIWQENTKWQENHQFDASFSSWTNLWSSKRSEFIFSSIVLK